MTSAVIVGMGSLGQGQGHRTIKGRKSLFPQCKISIGSKPGSIKHRALKVCVQHKLISYDRSNGATYITKCTHSQVSDFNYKALSLVHTAQCTHSQVSDFNYKALSLVHTAQCTHSQVSDFNYNALSLVHTAQCTHSQVSDFNYNALSLVHTAQCTNEENEKKIQNTQQRKIKEKIIIITRTFITDVKS